MGILRILVVDDHEFIRKGVRALLAPRADMEVCGEAVDGLQAVERACALRPDVVLMDVSMPHMNGLDATRILRRELPESKIVIISQNDPAVTRVQAQEIGAAGHIAKARLGEDLLMTLDKVVAGSSLNTEKKTP